MGVCVPIGRVNPEQLEELARLSDVYGKGEIRLTTGQNAIIPHVPAERVAKLLYEPLLKLPAPKVPIALTVPEPNTWRELLQAIDASQPDLRGKRIAVQEYGASNPELIEGLRERGAHVTRVPVSRWGLPEATGPLHAAVSEVIAGPIDVALFTTGVQIDHRFQIAEQEGKKDKLKEGMERLVKASIGPMTSGTLRSQGLLVDLEASHPKMGFLVKEAAEQAEALVQQVRSRSG